MPSLFLFFAVTFVLNITNQKGLSATPYAAGVLVAFPTPMNCFVPCKCQSIIRERWRIKAGGIPDGNPRGWKWNLKE